MPDQPDKETIDRLHRWFGIECNNSAWELTAQKSRTEADDQEMLHKAHAAVWHWSKIGTPLHVARGETLLAHVYATLGDGAWAMHYAGHCLDWFENNPCEDWDLCFAHAMMAHAAAAAGDADLHHKHWHEAKTRGQAIKEEGDRKQFFSEFARIPAAL